MDFLTHSIGTSGLPVENKVGFRLHITCEDKFQLNQSLKWKKNEIMTVIEENMRGFSCNPKGSKVYLIISQNPKVTKHKLINLAT